MSSQYPPDQGWGNRSNASPHMPPNLAQGDGGQQAPAQGNWPPYSGQPEYMPVQQQTYLNNNIGPKPPFYPAPSWNQMPPQQQPFQQVPPNVYFNQPATTSPAPGPNPYANAYGHQQSFPPLQNYQSPQPQNFAPMQQQQQPPPAASMEECWTWGDESGSDSPATSTPNNNWGSQTPASIPSTNSVHSFFQQSPTSSRQNSLPIGRDMEQPLGNSSVRTAENVAAPQYHSESFQYRSPTNEVKPERLSPDANKIPLTTQALREFHKEACENGPGVHRLGMEGLTPQWSIESQLSQETVSDDVLSSQVDGCDVDGLQQDGRMQNLRRLEDVEESHYQSQMEQVSGEDDASARFSTLTLSETENKEVITPEQQRALNLDRRFAQNGFAPSPPNRSEIVDENLSHAQGDGSSNPVAAVKPPVIDAGPPIGGFKPFDKKPSSPRPGPSVYGPSPVVQHSPRPDVHTMSSEYVHPEIAYPQNPPQRPVYPEDNFRPSPAVPNEEPVIGRPLTGYTLPLRPTIDLANLETIPDNKERPDMDMRAGRFPPPQHGAWYGAGPDNQEVTPRGDRNQYLETGQLADQDVSLTESVPETDVGENLPPPGLSRLVTGAGHNIDMPTDTLTPPPGLDREVLGRLTDAEISQPISIATPSRSGLQRMVMGQPTDEPTGFPRMVPGESSSPENQAQSPPPADSARQRNVGYPRMVPGESSSPEISIQTSSPAADARVVPGVARDDAQNTALSLPTSPPGGRRSSLNDSPDTQTRNQPQAERSETIGSDHVETFTTNPPDNCPKPSSSKRRNKERRRDEGSSEEGDSTRRHDRDRDYYRGRERDVPSSRDRHSIDWERRRERSPQRYHDDRDRDRRRGSPDRYRDDARRRKPMRYSDDEEDDDYSDRERSYREDFDRSYTKRDERARSQRPDKSERRDERDKRRGYERDVERNRESDHRSYDYYRRRGHDEPDDYHDQRSRPSSRNDSSIHDFKGRGLSSRSNIDRESERDHYRGSTSKRERDLYYTQTQNYNYNPMAYNLYYQQYYEQLRRLNPTAYAEMVRKYQASLQHGAYSEDRGSVHSGRSSANEDGKDRAKDFVGALPMQLVNPYYLAIPTHVTPAPMVPIGVVQTGRSLDASVLPEEPQKPPRLTPVKFSTAHVKGILTARGQLIKIPPHYPHEGQPATIEVHESLLCCQTTRAQLQDFPGPLIKGVTHKNNVIRYCQQKIKDADYNPDLVDKDSYKLIWELLILLIRQNGTIEGTDIAELLMNQRSAQPPAPSPATSHHSINELPGQQILPEDEVTNKFRDLLIYGNTKEALEWAMKHGLWGHALFLASKMDTRTYARVMTRFANGLLMSDPLQTLYQLMSGRQPTAVTCCMDERWGDWRPHLAMILSNQQSARTELGRKAIATLGDTLGAHGSLYAAHFCYLIAQQDFGSYSQKSSKIVLIGSSHNLPFHLFATNEAIFATEILEFACNLADSDFVYPHLQVYKLLVARRLAEVGMAQEAVHYVEVVANTIMKNPSTYSASFIQEVYDLGNMLKFSDPVYTSSENEGVGPEWLQQLQPVLADYQSGALQHNAGCAGSISNLTTYSDGPEGLPLDASDQSWQQQQEQMYTPQIQNQRFQPPPMQPNFTPQLQQEPPKALDSYGVHQQQDLGNYGGSSTDTPNYWTPPPPANQWSPPEIDSAATPATPPEQPTTQLPQTDYFDISRSEAPPSISLPGANQQRMRTTSQSSDVQPVQQRRQSSEPPRGNQQQHQQQQQQQLQQKTPGWFGGLWTKLSLRPKNQMHLPDDTNPSIIYDADKKRWIDQNADDDDGTTSLAPPPMAPSRVPAPAPASAPAPGPGPGHGPTSLPYANTNTNPMDKPMPPSGPNMYKMPRGRTLRGNYIDVMNPGDKTQKPSAVPAPDLFPSLNYPNQRAKLFVPPAADGQEGNLKLFSPASADTVDHTQHQGLSRWSSTSSLSREVQKYTSMYTSTSRTHAQVFGGQSGAVDGMVAGQWNSNGVLGGGTLPRSKNYK